MPPSTLHGGAEPLLSIIVPVYNEAGTIAAVLDRLRTVPLPVPREIIVVNDGSTDETRTILESLGTAPGVTVLHADRNRGKGNAIRLGLTRAEGSIVAIQDADLELDPADLAALVQPIADGTASVVYGSRFLAGPSTAPWLTVAANRFLTGLTNLLYGASITDMETCYKVMRTEIARSLGLESDRFDIEPEITAKLLRGGWTIAERPVRFDARSRAAGKKIGWRDGVHAVIVLVRHRFAKRSDGARAA
jgi:glycosyltransferase involved in cell wall biosynthesis